ncbi:MAG: hypothetical protein KIT27_06930 [Legionellales bacterium]|nr:hypothetical protein [Legionellales bacterium]
MLSSCELNTGTVAKGAEFVLTGVGIGFSLDFWVDLFQQSCVVDLRHNCSGPESTDYIKPITTTVITSLLLLDQTVRWCSNSKKGIVERVLPASWFGSQTSGNNHDMENALIDKPSGSRSESTPNPSLCTRLTNFLCRT